MAMPTLLLASWRDGLLVVSEDAISREFPGQSVCGVTPDGRGGAIAIVGGRSLCRRMADGAWRTIATSEIDVACCIAAGDVIYAGTDDARVLRIDAEGRMEALSGFDAVAGRDRWYSGAAIVDGQRLGPPLGIRSMSMTCEGAVLLANVHVGGIPRSLDGGASWQPTIDIDADVHQVCAHPSRPNVIAAAAAAGLCLSRDAGATWTIARDGLHAHYCSAVAFAGDDVLVAASDGHFATEGAIYRRPVDGRRPLQPVSGGLPRWIAGICDTSCIAARDSVVVLADRTGNLYRSADSGHSWSCLGTGLDSPSAVAIL